MSSYHQIKSIHQKSETVAVGAGTLLLKISPTVLVKYGTHASLIEAKTMAFIAEQVPSFRSRSCIDIYLMTAYRAIRQRRSLQRRNRRGIYCKVNRPCGLFCPQDAQ